MWSRPDNGPIDDVETRSIDNAEVVHATELAILVKLGDGPFADKVWIPKSVVHDDSDVTEDDRGPGVLIVAEWWADRELS